MYWEDALVAIVLDFFEQILCFVYMFIAVVTTIHWPLYRAWMVRLVPGVACARRRTALEVHQRWICQRLGLALHRLSHHACCSPTRHAVRPNHPVTTFNWPCDLSVGFQAGEHNEPQHCAKDGCISSCLCSAQLSQLVFILCAWKGYRYNTAKMLWWEIAVFMDFILHDWPPHWPSG